VLIVRGPHRSAILPKRDRVAGPLSTNASRHFQQTHKTLGVVGAKRGHNGQIAQLWIADYELHAAFAVERLDDFRERSGIELKHLWLPSEQDGTYCIYRTTNGGKTVGYVKKMTLILKITSIICTKGLLN